jgi:hypothetical protein
MMQTGQTPAMKRTASNRKALASKRVVCGAAHTTRYAESAVMRSPPSQRGQ